MKFFYALGFSRNCFAFPQETAFARKMYAFPHENLAFTRKPIEFFVSEHKVSWVNANVFARDCKGFASEHKVAWRNNNSKTCERTQKH